jgi:hypothetical protein
MKLNAAYATRSWFVAAVAGGLVGSLVVFACVLVALLASNVALGEIRL